MKTKIHLTVFVVFFITLFALPLPALADGVIIPEPPICLNCPVPPPPPREVPYFTVQSHRVTVSIDRQIATTRVEQVFRNDSQWSLEGTYIFPLPTDAAISQFSMWIEGEKVQGQLYTKQEARRIYDEIVRRRLDPALLEYLGRDLFQASIFPVEPGDTRRVVIEYSQILPLENGLVKYVYPLSTEKFSARPLEDVSVSVDIHSDEAIKAVYSPSHPVSVDRPGDYQAVAGWEDHNVIPNTDFALYYTLSPEDLGLNLLSFKNEDEDGFFTMLIAPSIETGEVIEKDVILVLDTSGSMEGEKLEQAQQALNYVLEHLNPGDRFNVVAFSTGVRSFARTMEPLSAAPEAKRFVQNLRAEGSTDINRALLQALDSLDDDSARPAIIIFLTDGLPTSGVTEADLILNNIAQAAPPNARIFPFGVGDDVDTFLLDSLAREQRGASAYVRPGERVDEAVSEFYAKVSAPVLTDIDLQVDGVQVEEIYPYPLPDLFAGTQLILTGRYRQGGPARVTLSGLVNGRPQSFHYNDLTFVSSSLGGTEGGQDFIPRLWATRKIGYLLNQIRLHGETTEAIEQIVNLSIRYGIITPYTSFLVEEPEDALTQSGRDVIVQQEAETMMSAPAEPRSGAGAVQKAVESMALESADMAAPVPLGRQYQSAEGDANFDSEFAQPGVIAVGDKAFVLRNNVWTDTTFDPEQMTTTPLSFASAEFMDFLAQNPQAGKYFALGEQVIVLINGRAYQSTPLDGEAASVSQNEGPIVSTPTTQAQTQDLRPAPTAANTPVTAIASERVSPNPSSTWGLIGLIVVVGIFGLGAVLGVVLVRLMK